MSLILFFYNQFRSDVALIYNDRSVLENHHVSAAFRLMQLEDYNIVSEFTPEEYKYEKSVLFSVYLFSKLVYSYIQGIFDTLSLKWCLQQT